MKKHKLIIPEKRGREKSHTLKNEIPSMMKTQQLKDPYTDFNSKSFANTQKTIHFSSNPEDLEIVDLDRNQAELLDR